MQRLLASALLTLFALGTSAYPTDPLTGDLAKWEVSPSPGAPTVILNGTVEHVYAKLLELNPNYDEDWAGVDEDDNVDGYLGFDLDNDTDDTAEDTSSDVEAKTQGLHARTMQPLHPRKHLSCEASWDADQWHIKQGIKYLRKVKANPTHLPGQCGQVSCSGDSGIYWCNFDPKRTKVLPSYNNIADGAQVILDNCKRTQNGVRGKLGHDDLWTVFVQKAKC
ncbi:hypothetical protein ASPCAL07665 [Aspergillus calidoustus]|uniref:Secreted protein n=1 Tax=Aspergillus calidoustus TaxID=454130 RepID=A0A0U5GUY5_ASPCI|nr:hypothetical protein ASPCAL07665 [Aspergillus calidoustus]